MDCAICRLPMKSYMDRGVELDVCANDHTFFDVHELGQLDAQGRELQERLYEVTLDKEPDPKGRRCPGCQSPMIHVPHHSRKAEVCGDCGGVMLWNKAPLTDADRAVLALAGLSAVPSPSRPSDAGFAVGDSINGLGETAGLLMDGASASEGVGLLAGVDAIDLVGGAAELAMHTVGGVLSFLGGVILE